MFPDNVQHALNALTQRKDVLLASLLVAIIFMMILPLPTALVDVLIGTSMGIAVVLLMLAVYISSAGEFFAFPAVLLLSTLFRLALAIATTRLVLLQADAGAIIDTFGNFVVAGNLVVGLVIFLIITIVQFLVITKGAERVAEVSARFSLDAMPGKQMSIDGDMRAGVIDMNEARRRREKVEKESQLYGSMDGAMKFVKGDAIAGLIIIAVNLVGGLVIGVTQRGMSIEEAMQVYSILTIGDGLVAQIPALLIAMTAGIIVTRVSTDDTENLATDIGEQFGAQPKALLVAGALMVAFSLIPGFPTVTFLALATVTGGTGILLMRASRRRAGAAERDVAAVLTPVPAEASTEAEVEAELRGEQEITLGAPLLMDISASLQEHLDMPALNREAAKVRRALYLDLGVPFPGMHVRFNENLAENAYAILLQEIPVARGELRPGNVLYADSPRQLDVLRLPHETGEPFLPNVPTVWLDSAHAEALAEASMSYLEMHRVLTFHLAYVMKRYAEEFIGIQETYNLFGRLEQTFPDLIKEAQRVLPVNQTTEVFKRLVGEDISIRNVRLILESLVEWGQQEKDVVVLTEYVRGNLKRYISYKYSSDQNVLSAYLLDEDVEELVRGGIRQTASGNYLALEPSATRQLVAQAKSLVGDIGRLEHKPVVVTAMDIRRYVRKMLELEISDLAVLSFQELTPEVTVQPLGRIAL
ncbi:MAG: EscV/YscV/HrcV family type III secretion system export apparatus protein [Gammaproteobacteria bacterium]|nr:EscV/YscV/HrcV family type III secretion system export apparatus protein [Gammaproteobacteria bacterium]MYF30151.1 EscV/YscV/HrcV family type III secretion system export apparatus protein [Gammaproteobacteria bacterium]MYK44674.1 EscV/YscV/HrcV family type III secretion system export apparatus protein [Gammaproteobacteria bacterium]